MVKITWFASSVARRTKAVDIKKKTQSTNLKFLKLVQSLVQLINNSYSLILNLYTSNGFNVNFINNIRKVIS